MARRILVIPVVAGLAAILALGLSSTVAHAECTQLDPWPSFRAAARSADTIVIGRVVTRLDDRSGGSFVERFVFHVDEVLRGRSRRSLVFTEGVWSGLPLTICPDDSILRVGVGHRLAFAFGARYEGVRGPVTAVAFLNRTPDAFLMPGMERLTAAEVRFISGLPQTDTESGAPIDRRVPAWVPLLVGAVAGLLWLRLRPRVALP